MSFLSKLLGIDTRTHEMHVHNYEHKVDHAVEQKLERAANELVKGNTLPARTLLVEFPDNVALHDFIEQVAQDAAQAAHEADTAKLLDSQSEFRINDW